MKEVYTGPQFNVASDRAVIILGHSERLGVGQLWVEELDRRRLFEEIDLITLNRSAAMVGRAALREHLKRSTVFTHSAGITRVDKALQVIAINPPEPVDGIKQLIKRAMVVGEDPIEAELGAHKTGNLDLALAGVELLRSPISTLRTMHMIGVGGYSTVDQLRNRPKDFRAGRAIVHAASDAFGFGESADMRRDADSQVSTLFLDEGTFHNSILFAPDKILSAMTPTILPASS